MLSLPVGMCMKLPVNLVPTTAGGLVSGLFCFIGIKAAVSPRKKGRIK